MAETDEETQENEEEELHPWLDSYLVSGVLVIVISFLIAYFLHSIGLGLEELSRNPFQMAGLVGFVGLGFMAGFSSSLTGVRGISYVGLVITCVFLFTELAYIYQLMGGELTFATRLIPWIIESISWPSFLVSTAFGFLVASLIAR